MLTNSFQISESNYEDGHVNMFSEYFQSSPFIFSIDENLNTSKAENNCDENKIEAFQINHNAITTLQFDEDDLLMEYYEEKSEVSSIHLPHDTPSSTPINDYTPIHSNDNIITPQEGQFTYAEKSSSILNKIDKSNKIEEDKKMPTIYIDSKVLPTKSQQLQALPHSSHDLMQQSQPKARLEIVNIVSVANLNCKIDLEFVARKYKNCEYKPSKLRRMIMRIEHPCATANIFNNGKIMCFGTKSEEESKKASKKIAKAIKSLGYEVKFTEFKIVNIVASAYTGHKINLESLSFKHKGFCEYEPEFNSYAIYTMHQPRVILNIFASGSFNILGAKTREDIRSAFDSIVPQLRRHQKGYGQ